MALSNWDTLAVDLDGKPTMGSFASPVTGVVVEFYKNWIYIYDEKAWVEGSGYSKPCIATIQHGDFKYKDVSIEAVRGPQNGIYAVVTVGYGETMAGMIGCGVYGFEGEEWIGVTAESTQFLQDFISKPESMPTREEAIEQLKSMSTYTVDELGNESRVNRYDELVAEGDADNLERCIKIFMEPTFQFDEKIRAVSLAGAKRFNQGDAYFADSLGFNVPVTKPGNSAAPLLDVIIGKK